MTRFHPDARLTRRALSVAALSAAALGVVGCSKADTTTSLPSGSSSMGAPSGSTTPSASASTPAASAGKPTTIKNLDSISVSGKVGDLPTVRAQWPITIAETTSKVLVAGDGAKVSDPTATVEVHYAGFNCRNGQRFDDSFSAKKTAAFPLNGVVPGFSKGLLGKKVGDRVLIMMPSKDGYAEGNPQAGIEAGDALIFVVEIKAVSLKAPEGETVAPKAGLPTVKDNGAKAPTVTIPADLAKPTALVVQPLIKGKGRAVTAADTLMVNYTMVSWDGKVLAESYTTGPETGALASLIEGWKQGLVKQTVGSRVLLLVPPALGYPKGLPEKKVAAGESLVFVVDILFAQPAA